MKFFDKSIVKNLYFIAKGQKYGEFLVVIEETLSNINVLSLSCNKSDSINLKDFNKAIDDKVLEFVKKLPTDIWKVCKEQYVKNLTKIDK